MENWLYASLPTIVKTVLTVVAILTAMVVIVRVAGLRTFAKMSSIDFASTIALGSVLATVVMNGGQSILKGVVALATIVLYQQLFSFAKRGSGAFENLTENQPILLMEGPDILKKNLSATGVTHGDLMAKLREANVLQFSEVRAVVFETTGDISVLHGDVAVAEELLKGVKR